MIRYAFSLTAVAVLLTACAETTSVSSDTDPLTAALSGKSLVNGNDVFFAASDGTLTGTGGPDKTKFAGTWEIVNGDWCRTFTEPAQFAGRACQKAALGDGTVTIEGERGPRTWVIR